MDILKLWLKAFLLIKEQFTLRHTIFPSYILYPMFNILLITTYTHIYNLFFCREVAQLQPKRPKPDLGLGFTIRIHGEQAQKSAEANPKTEIYWALRACRTRRDRCNNRSSNVKQRSAKELGSCLGASWGKMDQIAQFTCTYFGVGLGFSELHRHLMRGAAAERGRSAEQNHERWGGFYRDTSSSTFAFGRVLFFSWHWQLAMCTCCWNMQCITTALWQSRISISCKSLIYWLPGMELLSFISHHKPVPHFCVDCWFLWLVKGEGLRLSLSLSLSYSSKCAEFTFIQLGTVEWRPTCSRLRDKTLHGRVPLFADCWTTSSHCADQFKHDYVKPISLESLNMDCHVVHTNENGFDELETGGGLGRFRNGTWIIS